MRPVAVRITWIVWSPKCHNSHEAITEIRMPLINSRVSDTYDLTCTVQTQGGPWIRQVNAH